MPEVACEQSGMQTIPALSKALAALGLAVAVLCPGCERRSTAYDLDTPEGTLDAAAGMVAEGRADRLPELIQAEDPELRSLLNQFGRFLGELQTLGDAVERAMPEQVAAMREKAEIEAKEGRAASLIDRLTGAPAARGGFGVSAMRSDDLGLDTGGGRSGVGSSLFGAGQPSASQRERFNQIAQEVLIDPYAWLEDGRKRLDSTYVTDEMVALTWDGKTLLPPFGVVLVDDGGAWRMVLPTRYAGVSRVMPKTPDEFAVWGSMVRTLEHVVIDLRRDVERGRVTTLTGLADAAVEKVAIPATLVAFAFSRLMDERGAADASKTDEASDGENDNDADTAGSVDVDDPDADTEPGEAETDPDDSSEP